MLPKADALGAGAPFLHQNGKEGTCPITFDGMPGLLGIVMPLRRESAAWVAPLWACAAVPAPHEVMDPAAGK